MAYSKLELTGKVALVVGGTSGIGRAIVRGYAEAGADVIATSRREELVVETAREVEAMGRRSLAVTSDVHDRASLEAMTARVLDEFGRIDILVNCAGRTKKVPTLELSEEDWNGIIETNLTGTLRCCQVVGRHMLARKYGRIINIASLSSFVSLSEVTAYCVSKSGVAMLTKCLGCEWAKDGVNVNAIAPGVFRTELNAGLLDGTPRGQHFLSRTPKGRFGRVEELQGAAIFLASDAAEFVTGEILTVDGGYLAFGV
ncbi:MAG TPA: glucose 1-dehydrogenase [Blastocatellia bacterium]|nr:glucose 1-dehydrogenase [Blastocatellia bacterium]